MDPAQAPISSSSMMETEKDVQKQLTILRRQYFQLVEPPQLRWPVDSVLKVSSVQSWMYRHFFDAASVPVLPPSRYRLRVLKSLISKLEGAIEDPEEDEISDDLMNALSSLLGSNIPSEAVSAQEKSYVKYAYALDPTDENDAEECTVILLESRAVIFSSGTSGLRTWEAALVLGSFLVSASGRAMIQGKRVLELGAGTGMVSILCAKYLSPSAVVATDGDEAVVDAIRTNSFLNEVDTEGSAQTPVLTAALKWGWPVMAATFAEDYGMEAPDVILGADVTFDRLVVPALVSSLREFFELNSALQVLIAAAVRNEQTFEAFVTACRRNGFSLNLVDFTPLAEPLQDGPFYPTSTPIKLWQITRPQPPDDPFAF